MNTYAYLDYIIISGESKEDHAQNQYLFLIATKDVNLTLNQA